VSARTNFGQMPARSRITPALQAILRRQRFTSEDDAARHEGTAA
jgi:hypothetical protein